MKKLSIHFKYGCRYCGNSVAIDEDEFVRYAKMIYMCNNCGVVDETIGKWSKRKLANRILDLCYWDVKDNPPIEDK